MALLLLAVRRSPLLASGAAARTTALDVSRRHGNRRCVGRILSTARPASHAAGRGGGGAGAGQNLHDSCQTLTEKIVQRYSVGLPAGKVVRSGDYVTLRPHRCMTHDNSWPVALKFMAMGASQIHDSRQIVMTLDHDVQNRTEANLAKYRRIEEFAARQRVDFYPAGRGIGHQIMVEEGYAWPGTLTVASDSHSNMYGGVGCLGTPVVRTDAASIWATGRTWWQVPPVARVRLSGTLPRGATGKDLIVALCGRHSRDEVLNHAVEFTGPEETMRSLPVDDRLTIANMTTEWGALTGLFPIDPTLQAWLRARAASNPSPTGRFSQNRLAALAENRLGPDPGARYAKTLSFDLSTLCPTVAGPNSVKIATPIDQLEAQHIRLNKAYLVSCTNSRASDIAAAARVFREAAAAAATTDRDGSVGGSGGSSGDSGNVAVVAPGVKFYIAAASSLEQRAAEEAGDWQVLLAAGAQPLPAGCGPCIGLGTGLLEPGEVGISASNRNFKGRMGSTEAKAYLASPEIVAASALKGEISGPGWYQKGEEPQEQYQQQQPTAGAPLISSTVDDGDDGKYDASALASVKEEEAASAEDTLTEILPGFPAEIGGEIVFCDGDNINTDGIYPGKYTYQDDVTVDRMAEVCMENYDPAFGAIARPGDILAAGFNFGCGSSREQAATAILARRIPLVVAGSFGNIFSRNSINNALMGVEVPRLVRRLRDVFGQGRGAEEQKKAPLTRRTGWRLVWDVRRSRVVVTEGEGGPTWSERVGELPPNVQEIIARGGLEGWVKAQIGLNQASTGEDGR